MKLRLGIIGAGNIAATHVQNVLDGKCPDIEITAVADRKESRRRWAQEKLPGAAIFCEGSELIAARPCDAVLIAVPHYQHPPLAIEAFRAGLHVMCEKPAGVYTLQVREMMAEADRHPELTFGMMFNQRTNCVYRKIKELLDAGELGQIKRVNWIVTDWYRTQFYYDSGAWRATWAGEGGGVLLNQCPHQLDLLQWLCGLPVRVHAFCHEGKWHDIEVEDDVTAYLEFANGATGVFVTTTADAPGTNRLEFTGTKGRVICENDTLVLTGWRWTSVPGAQPAARASPSPRASACRSRPTASTRSTRRCSTPLPRTSPPARRWSADGREGINGLLLSNAIHLSSWTGETVALPFDEQRFLALLNERRARSPATRRTPTIVMDTSGSFGSQVR